MWAGIFNMLLEIIVLVFFRNIFVWVCNNKNHWSWTKPSPCWCGWWGDPRVSWSRCVDRAQGGAPPCFAKLQGGHLCILFPSLHEKKEWIWNLSNDLFFVSLLIFTAFYKDYGTFENWDLVLRCVNVTAGEMEPVWLWSKLTPGVFQHCLFLKLIDYASMLFPGYCFYCHSS